MTVSEDKKTSEVARLWKTLHEGVQDLSGGEFVTHLCGLIEPDNGESAP